ncbi:MAG TPA: pyruvate, phosphate dikinase, partial [Phycisphaerae bacterium]|nr:pyruvate, phosphate dikinase [Phycisphaerae bacterium]
MAQIDSQLSTGLVGLDGMLKGLIPGDNLVWQVESVEDYAPFLPAYCRAAAERSIPLIYFRFAKHRQLIADGGYAEVHHCDPQQGLEGFLSSIHRVIERHGRGGYYVFDCLSDLAYDWCSDQMLGNFFMLTCPFLYDIEAIAYFALLRNRHSYHATAAISDTTQVLLDIYRHKEHIYIHPWKVQGRYSATMHMPHIWQDDTFRPITDSATVSEIMTSVPWGRLESSGLHFGIWNRTRARAEEVIRDTESGKATDAQQLDCLKTMLRMAITREPRILALAEKYMTLQDVLDVEDRMIGTGLIGGKAVGMLLARAIIRADASHLQKRSEPHDSFYIG